ncbi:endoglucanase [Gracilibacillus halotolerans]|uniref:Endoglucanase n=1 Tax=Gracilibacillus halotolerans TaxID=74386 RepID=A0A841RMV0_9BACI|nr:cellulase family glycosylhydrolase [Gracilibacillus halotolerans]MBB6512495.1 endoglucanase [Gracilibacillus halotolerans]
MKKFQLILKTSIYLSLFIFLAPTISLANETANQTIDMEQYAENMQPGWNLGNTYDALGEDETAWGNPMVTRELIQQIAAEGFQSIRVPITFDGRMNPSGDFAINEEFLSRVQQTVDWALEEDLYVMINVHHDSWVWLQNGMENNHDQTVERFRRIWEQLSERFQDYPVELMFESINEPQFTGDERQQQGYLDELNDAFHQVVRNSNGNNPVRPIVLPTLLTGQEPERLQALYDYISNLNDPHVLATVHYYGFWPFSVNIAGVTRFNDETKNDIDTIFNRVHDQFTANGIPVVIGEYGLLGFDTGTDVIQQGEKLKYFEYMIPAAQDRSFVHMLWDNGQHLNRHSLNWHDAEFAQMIKTSWNSRSAVPNNNFIYLNNQEDRTDHQIDFKLNGHQLDYIKLNNQTLIAGEDYLFEDGNLILKKERVEALSIEGETGHIATLHVVFTGGFNWDINIYQHGAPVFQEADGTSDNFQIPVSFEGNHLATMEAHYEDGTIAGPQNWTSFKEFGYTFSPDYDNNTITLTENFFNDIEDGREVTLTFHFWRNDNEEQLSYKIVKNGDQVTGWPVIDEEDAIPDEENGEEIIIEEDKVVPDEDTIDEEHVSHNDEKNTNNQDKQELATKENNPNSQNEQMEESSLAPTLTNHKLPDTATNLYSWLIAGLGLLLIGATIFISQRRRRVNH